MEPDKPEGGKAAAYLCTLLFMAKNAGSSNSFIA
jgi:hypothetical protein